MPLRAPMPDDAPAVLAVLEARDKADLGESDYTLGDVLDEWRAPGFDLLRDAVVAEDDGRILAYAAVRRPGAVVAVAPAHDGRGLDKELLRWAEQRERELGRDCHRQWVGAGNAHAQALLQAAGYRQVRSYWRMSRELATGPVAAPVPEGLALRPLEPERDAVAAHALDRDSFAASPDYIPESLEEFRAEHLEAHDFDAGLSLVAEDGERVAGILLARRWTLEAVGFVDILAVHPEFQRRGLGTAMLTAAFARFAAAGLREAQLGVASDNPRALALYKRAGMTTRFRADTFERPVVNPGTPGGRDGGD